jgi:predicted nucleic acid-binding protein
VELSADVSPGPIALDTVAFVYFIEEHPLYLPVVEPIFAGIAAGRWEAITSALTLLETLVVPYRAGDTPLAERYEALLTRSRGLHLVELSRHLLKTAAHLRAVTRVKTPDALQLAAALTSRCRVYLTNDRDLPAIPGIRVLQLGQYTGTPRPRRGRRDRG